MAELDFKEFDEMEARFKKIVCSYEDFAAISLASDGIILLKKLKNHITSLHKGEKQNDTLEKP